LLVLETMRQPVLKTLWVFLLLACTLPIISFSQSLTGIWRGYFVSDNGDNYKLEFQVKQNTAAAVSGVSYSYLDTRFYGKATMTGSFTLTAGNFRIREIKTVEVRNMGYGNTCIMNYNLVYSKSGKEEFLEGTYLGKPEVKDKVNPYEWGECGGGKVFLRKVTTSDFPLENFLRKPNNALTKNIPSKPPVSNPTAKTATPAPINKPKSLAPVVKPKTGLTVVKPKTQTTNTAKTIIPPRRNNIDIPKVKDSLTVKVPDIKNQAATVKPPVVLADVLKTRTNELMKSLVVHDPDVTVKLYDNGEIDDDTISVFFDNKLVLSKKKLTASPLIVKLKMDEQDASHELVMVAENLGRIPPNTSLMIVEAGEQRFEVRITSNEQKNAMVRFRYEKPQ
jgi:hypothetical protein